MSINTRPSLPTTCLHPTKIVNRRYTSNKYSTRTNYRELVSTFFIRKRDYLLNVPCGKCYLCRKKRANEWRFRLMAEYTSTQKAVFFTLTFENDNDITDYEKDKQILIRRWRQNYQYHTGCAPRYFISEDVGSEAGRLHFHGLLFNPTHKDGTQISTTWLRRHNFFWKYGFTNLSWVRSPRAITYVTGYITGANLQKEAKNTVNLFVRKPANSSLISLFQMDSVSHTLLLKLLAIFGVGFQTITLLSKVLILLYFLGITEIIFGQKMNN